MSKINISPNLFLEKCELDRFRKFVVDDGYKKLLRLMTDKYGIFRNAANTYFKLNVTTAGATLAPGLAVDQDYNLITLTEEQTIDISQVSATNPLWVVVSYATTSLEEGKVLVASDGTLTGTDTKFTEVLRGQPNFPTKVRFPNSTVNTADYEVVKVTSDTQATLSGNLVDEANQKYAVIGTFTPGFIPNENNKLIYQYDSCQVELIYSETQPTVAEGKFIVGSITRNASGGIEVNDLRSEVTFGEKSLSGTKVSSADLTNPLVSLVSTKLWRNNATLSLRMQMGLQITSFVVHNYVDAATTFEIVTAESNILNLTSSTAIEDDYFKGWLLINTADGTKTKIDGSTGSTLTVSEFVINETAQAGTYIVVPDYDYIDFDFAVTPYGEDTLHFHHQVLNTLAENTFALPLWGTTVTVGITFRLVKDDVISGTQIPAAAAYTDNDGNSKTLSNGQFTLTFPVATTKLDDYS